MFKEYNQSQELLVPTAIKEFLWKSHPAVLLNDVVENINLQSLLNTYKNKNWWTTAFHPRMLLKVIFYWYMTQTFSSRWIANKLCSDLWFMYLAANNKPDFRTINRFRWERLNVVKDIFIEIVKMLQKLWVVHFWTVSLDWTKIYANAAGTKNYTEDWLDKIIEKLLQDATKIDEEEDILYWDKQDLIPEELTDPEYRKKRIKELVEEAQRKKEAVVAEKERKKEQGINQDRINLIDKDSRMMQMKHKDFANWYNAQIITENQIILSTYTSNNPSDVQDLIPTLEWMKLGFNELPQTLVADKWYSSSKNYEFLDENWIDCYIPPFQKLQINLSNFVYDKANNTYQDKDWNIYFFKQYSWIEWWKRWRPTGKTGFKPQKYKSKIYMSVLPDGKRKMLEIYENWQKYHKINAEKNSTKEWKMMMKRRWSDVETVFANIKRNLKFTRFNLRSFKKISIERDLVCLVHNLKKLFTHSIA